MKKKTIYDKNKIRRILDIDIYPAGGGKINLEKFIDTAEHIEVNEETFIILNK